LTSNRLSIEASGLPSTIARPPTGFEPNATAKTSPAAEFQLNTGPGQDDFAQTFALQIKDMNRSGLQEATLHLHPADLGSIAVQISLDGAQAQVNFSAERPETRELLQHHMGDLARALQDAGLGFSGSDVRDQSSRNGGNNGQAFSQEQAFSQSIRLSNDAARNAEAVGLTPFAANSNTATSSIANGRLDLFA
jgi:flagellar hook-length control protein FliK